MSFILFGLAIMASSLNLLVLRLAQFNSEHGTRGISALLGRNEEDLIAAAIAHHRASIHIQQRNRICANNEHFTQQQKLIQSYGPLRTYSCNSGSSFSSCPSSSNSKFDFDKRSHDRACCSPFALFRTRKRRHWHLRRSPQNIKHLLYLDHMLDNHKLTAIRKPPVPYACHRQHFNHVLSINPSKQQQQRVSI